MSAGEPPALALLGPTAMGKTDCAAALVERLPFEIVSVDSAMVYRGLDIGSAKPDAALLARAPHRMIDLVEPEEHYSAWRYAREARRQMRAIRAAGRVPLLVGGSRLYFLALLHGLSPMPDPLPAVRARLRRELRAAGPAALHARLRRCDPATAGRLAPGDGQRILRALEVYEASGRPLSAWTARAPAARPRFDCRQLALVPADRAALHRRIGRRFDRMLAAGLLDEVRRLRARPGLTAAHPSMRCVGYRQVWRHLDGEFDREELRARAAAATRQLAKRQLSWLRHAPDVLHFPLDRPRVEPVLAAAARWYAGAPGRGRGRQQQEQPGVAGSR